MRVVIAGSTGLIGTALVPLLRQAGYDVVRLVRRAPAAPDERGWDPPAGRIDDDALDGADAVVNLGGVGIGDKRWSGERKQAIRDSRIVPTDVLARAVAAHRVPVLVNASGIGFYGDTGSEAVDEGASNGSGFSASVARDWEAATAPAADTARVVLLRSGLVISPAGGLMGRLRPLFSVLLGGRLGTGQQYMSWISLDDEARAIGYLLENPAISGAVNLTAPEPVTNATFTRELAAAMQRPAPWVIPEPALKVALGREAAEELALRNQRVLPAVLRRHRYDFRHHTLTEALAAALGT